MVEPGTQEVLRTLLGASLVLLGASHVVRARGWVDFFDALLERPDGTLIIGMYTLPVALVVVVLHNVWEVGTPALVTLVGWVMLLKAAAYLLWGGTAKKLAPKHRRQTSTLRVAGVVMVSLGSAILLGDLLRGPLDGGAG
ncbi:MAG: hypothetical protein AAFX05_05035 [Planctomycetota bacterium]